jgi:amino acid permease
MISTATGIGIYIMEGPSKKESVHLRNPSWNVEMDSKSVDKHVIAGSVSNGPSDEIAGEVFAQGVASNGNVIDDGLQRGLKGRHLQMIALGGVVG